MPTTGTPPLLSALLACPQGAPTSPLGVLPRLALSCTPDLGGGEGGLVSPSHPSQSASALGHGPRRPSGYCLSRYPAARGRQTLGRRPRGPQRKLPSKDPPHSPSDPCHGGRYRRPGRCAGNEGPVPEAEWALKGRRAWQRGGSVPFKQSSGGRRGLIHPLPADPPAQRPGVPSGCEGLLEARGGTANRQRPYRRGRATPMLLKAPHSVRRLARDTLRQRVL